MWSLALSTCFGLPLVSVFRHPDVAWKFKALVVATVLLPVVTPATGLLVFAGLLPLALAKVSGGLRPVAVVAQAAQIVVVVRATVGKGDDVVDLGTLPDPGKAQHAERITP